MKTRTILGLGFAAAISWSAWAEEPIDPTALGGMDAMIASCRQLDPGGASGYDALRGTMLGEHSASALAAAGQTPEYQQAFEAARKKAEAEPQDSALKSCALLASALNPRVSHGEQRTTPSPKTKIAKTKIAKTPSKKINQAKNQ